jgi:hypothetical protein
MTSQSTRIRAVSTVMLWCLFSGIALLPGSVMAVPPSYPLVCRGGGGLQFQYDASPAGGYLRMTFRRGSAAAGSGAAL